MTLQRESAFKVLRTLWVEDGFRLFYKGLTARLSYSCFYSFLIILGYETVKKMSLKEEYQQLLYPLDWIVLFGKFKLPNFFSLFYFCKILFFLVSFTFQDNKKTKNFNFYKSLNFIFINNFEILNKIKKDYFKFWFFTQLLILIKI